MSVMGAWQFSYLIRIVVPTGPRSANTFIRSYLPRVEGWGFEGFDT